MARIWNNRDRPHGIIVDLDERYSWDRGLYICQTTPEHGRQSICITLEQIAGLLEAALDYLQSARTSAIPDDAEITDLWSASDVDGTETELLGNYYQKFEPPIFVIRQR